MNKKAIALLGGIFILIVATLGFLIFQKREAKTAASTPPVATDQTASVPPAASPPAPGGDQNTSPTAGNGANPGASTSAAPGKLSDDQIISPILTYAGTGITYLNNQGQLFRSDIQAGGSTVTLGNKKEITIAIKPGISQVLWPPTGNDFIAETESGDKRAWSFFDAAHNVYKDLPPQINSIAWMPDGVHIVYTWLNASTGQASLNISNADGSGYKKISDIYDGDAEIVPSPDGKTILFYPRTNTAAGVNKIVLTTPDGKLFRTVVSDGYNFGLLWAPDSRSFLFGRRDSATQKTELWLGDIQGNILDLGFATTVDKATWAPGGGKIIAAVPTKGTAGQGLTEDSLYSYTLSSQDKKEFSLGSAVDARNLFLNNTGDTAFFKNMQDGKLYYLSLSN